MLGFALRVYQEAVSIDPGFAKLRNHYGVALREIRATSRARASSFPQPSGSNPATLRRRPISAPCSREKRGTTSPAPVKNRPGTRGGITEASPPSMSTEVAGMGRPLPCPPAQRRLGEGDRMIVPGIHRGGAVPPDPRGDVLDGLGVEIHRVRVTGPGRQRQGDCLAGLLLRCGQRDGVSMVSSNDAVLVAVGRARAWESGSCSIRCCTLGRQTKPRQPPRSPRTKGTAFGPWLPAYPNPPVAVHAETNGPLTVCLPQANPNF